MRLAVPPKVDLILDNLNYHGYEAYVVGGCVRDSILARTPDDWDITTNASPFAVKNMFKRTVDTGLQHGTVTVLIRGDGFEVTTYRVDGEYEDSRHPKEVTFTANLEEDLKRRDFTINAMAYNKKQGLVDLFQGMDHLQKKVICCVGDPNQRFQEDALRIMRAVRFSAQLGFSIEKNTREAIVAFAPSLSKISAERIRTELMKLLVSDHPEYMQILYETGITKVMMPEFDRMMETEQNSVHHMYTVGEHTLVAMKIVPSDPILRLAMLLHDIGKPLSRTVDEEGHDHFRGHDQIGEQMARVFMRRLKYDNDTIDRVRRLVRWHDYRPEPEPKKVRKAVHKIGEDMFMNLLMIQKADTLAQSSYMQEEKLERIEKCAAVFKQIMEENQCVSLRTLAVNGNDLVLLGVQPGPRVGEILGELLDHVIDDPRLNNRQALLDIAKIKIQ